MYYWRSLSEKQREEVREHRRIQHLPNILHRISNSTGPTRYIVSARATNIAIVGSTAARMSECEEGVMNACEKFARSISPGHSAESLPCSFRNSGLKLLTKELGLFHGVHRYKGTEDDQRDAVWHNCFERRSIRTPLLCVLNYVLNNACIMVMLSVGRIAVVKCVAIFSRGRRRACNRDMERVPNLGLWEDLGRLLTQTA
jgi:hypothetical protein